MSAEGPVFTEQVGPIFFSGASVSHEKRATGVNLKNQLIKMYDNLFK